MEKEKSIHLQIEHKVPNFEGWKKAFESDPIDRKKAGVRRYQIFRPFDDPNYVIIDLEFDNLKEAEETLVALRNLWTKVEGKVMMNPQTRILKLAETVDI
jgi:hypothetical protein